MLLLNILGFFFLLRYAARGVQEYRAAEDKRSFFTFRRFRHSISLALITGIPLVVINILFPLIFPGLMNSGAIGSTGGWWISVAMAFLISAVWLVYMERLDIFEAEEKAFLAVTFVLACLSTAYLCTWMYGQLENLGISLLPSDSLPYSFLYCVFAIGGIEEFCKVLPVLILMMNQQNPIDEPYDYILYGSVSALGFAFVENIDYIYHSYLYNIGGRALYAAVAHMTFTSLFFYGLMLWRFKLTRMKGIVVIPLYFLLAMAVHGVYDFWLINDWLAEYRGMTTVFFLITVHLWVTMKNNAINVSNYYSPDVTLNNDRLRYYLIVSLSGLLMLGYLGVAVVHGRDEANTYLFYAALSYGYLIFYLAFGLSRYRIVREKMNPLQVPFDFFIPKPAPAERQRVEKGPEEEE